MYKYLGFGLLTLAAILMIPAQDVVSISNPIMYGMAVLSVYDGAGNQLSSNTVHNNVVNEGTIAMMGFTFDEDLNLAGGAEATQADAYCLTDAGGFAALNTITSVNFLTTGGGGTNGLDDDDGGTDASCIAVAFTLTSTSVTGATANFVTGTNVPIGTTITGFAVCDVDADVDGCTAANRLISAIASTVTLGTGETVDITYVLLLD